MGEGELEGVDWGNRWARGELEGVDWGNRWARGSWRV